MNIVKEPPLSPTSPPSKDPGELTPSHSTQNNPDIANGSHNQHTKSHHNNYNSDFDGEEVVDVNIEDDKEFFSDDEGYNTEAPEIPFPRKDSITNFDGDNHNVPSTPTKKKKKNKPALSISDIHHPHHNHNHKSHKDGIWNTNNNEERQRIREFWLKKNDGV
ncbi:stress response protein nst1 [Gigaspora margarita]|uniref:Stress response protein NST1 n=1 Tax=Gigaspora margarita TaxID=4874 RepID=A0A8H3XG84_GIGMA|nr:stress response protein nst1 [Gigaspora margarita]